MSDEKTTSVKQKIELWFSKENIPLKVVVDETKVRLDALIAFKAATPVGTIDKYEDLKTVDGLMLTIEPAVEKGAACVSIIEGVAEPVPPGEYKLEDGRAIIVIEAGIIDSVVEKPADDTPPADTPPVDDVELKDTNAKVKRLIEQVQKITEYSAVQDKKYAALEQKYNAVVTGLNTFKEDTKTLLEEVFSEEETTPVVKPKNPLKKDATPKKNVFLRSTQK